MYDLIGKNIGFRLIACLLCVNAAFAAKDQFPVPPGANLVAVADQMNYEGMTMRVRKFDIEMSVEEVLNFYRASWQGMSVENDMPPWKMISSKQDDRFYTVQVQPAGPGKSWGYLGTSDLPRMLEKGRQLGSTAKRFFPMMNGSKVVNDLDHNDTGRKARTLWINNHFSVSSNAEYYRGFYQEHGWTKLVDQSADAANNHVLVFQQGDKTVNMTIDRAEQGTNIIVNDIKNGLF
ncbi:MAG TPA: hypothetical protein VGL10_00655 [Gammaproteobacteria bacterium]